MNEVPSSAGWRWHRPPVWQPGCAMGSRRPGLVLDVALPVPTCVDIADCAALLEQALGPAMDVAHRGDGAEWLAWSGLQRLADRTGMPTAEPVRELHRAPGRLVLRAPVLSPAGSALAHAGETLLRALNDPAAARAAGESFWGAAFGALKASRPPTSNTLRFLRAADRIGLPVAELAGHGMQFGQGRRSRWLHSSYTESTSLLAAKMARDKAADAGQLRRAGLPVPVQQSVRDAGAAVDAARRIGFPVVVKPVDLDGGIGVSVGLTDDEAVRRAYERARAQAKKRAHSEDVLVEQFVPGRDYRLLVHEGELIWAVERVVAGVTGDGVASVERLVEALNADPRRVGPEATLRPVPLDSEALDLLSDADLGPASIPAAGRFVRLRRAANVATGGTPVAALDHVHPAGAGVAARPRPGGRPGAGRRGPGAAGGRGGRARHAPGRGDGPARPRTAVRHPAGPAAGRRDRGGRRRGERRVPAHQRAALPDRRPAGAGRRRRGPGAG